MAYIDRDLLLQDISESVVFTVRNAETSPELRGARKIVDRIKNAPTADVVEVKRGEWIERQEKLTWCEDDVEVYYKCSICGCNNFGESPYCPNCGAIMKGGKEE